MVKSYDPKKQLLIVGGIPMGGFADGTFIKVERENDSYAKKVGADGEVSRAKSNDKSGMITLTLLQTSPSNDVLAGFAILDELSDTGIVPVLMKDVGGTTTAFAGEGWIKKPSDITRSKEIENNEWIIDCANLEMFTGSN